MLFSLKANVCNFVPISWKCGFTQHFFLFLEECNPGFWGIFGGKHSENFDVIGLIIWMLCVLYSSLRSASKSSKITMSENMLIKDNGAGKK